MTQPETTLLPCPFCGDRDFSIVAMTYMHADGPTKGSRIKCLGCGCQVYDKIWNKRATSQPVSEAHADVQGAKEFLGGTVIGGDFRKMFTLKDQDRAYVQSAKYKATIAKLRESLEDIMITAQQASMSQPEQFCEWAYTAAEQILQETADHD